MSNKSSSPLTEATPEEKLRTLFQDQALRNAERRKDASTFSQFATSEANQDAGRFEAIKKATVVGATSKPPDYAAPNWSPDPVGVEPPLGIDVNAMEPVGESFEVAASIDRLERSTLSEATAPAASIISAAVEQPTSQGDPTPTQTGSSILPPAPSPLPDGSPNQSPTLNRRKPNR